MSSIREQNGYVDGASGNDQIDYAYTGDPQGDKIDHSDAVLSGAAPNDDYVRAGAGNDTVLAGLGGDDKVYGGNGNDLIHTSPVRWPLRCRIGYPGLYPADTDLNNDRDTVMAVPAMTRSAPAMMPTPFMAETATTASTPASTMTPFWAATAMTRLLAAKVGLSSTPARAMTWSMAAMAPACPTV